MGPACSEKAVQIDIPLDQRTPDLFCVGRHSIASVSTEE